MAYWYCLNHHAVEPDEGCPATERLGPYTTEVEASHALQLARERTEREDARDREEDA